jgi:hypothetical protein
VTGLDHASRSLPQVSQTQFIIGEVAEGVELIAHYAALGIGELACLMNFGGPDLATHPVSTPSLAWFARTPRADKRTEARELLASVYSWFTEGFDTADLGEAKALLEALS